MLTNLFIKALFNDALIVAAFSNFTLSLTAQFDDKQFYFNHALVLTKLVKYILSLMDLLNVINFNGFFNNTLITTALINDTLILTIQFNDIFISTALFQNSNCTS